MSAATRNLGPCLVCGHKAIGINFSVATCAPCKAFFRRNAVKLGTIEFNCQKDGDCPVVYNSRRMCNCCRLAKCFRVGMQKSLIRTESEKESRKEIVQQTRQRRAVLNQTFTHDPIRPSNLLCLSQSHSRQLSIEDQILLTNIFSAYERTCIVTRITHAPYYPSKPYSSIHTCLNEYTVRQRSLIEYFKLIPEFNSFTMDDKVRLIRNHFGSMFGINERICNDVISENAKLTIRNLFETDLANDFIHSIYLMSAYASDPMFLELVLVVRTLSSGFNRYHHDPDIDRIYDNTLKIFASQNIYVELLWRYLLSRLPSEQNAIKFFNKFILDLLFLQRTYIRLGCHIYRSKDELNRLHPLMQSMWPLNKQSAQTNGNDHVMKSWL